MATQKKETEQKTKTVTLPESDWKILSASLNLLAENVGKLGIEPKSVGNVYQNCSDSLVFILQV